MFIYALAKGVRQGYLNSGYLSVAQDAFKCVIAKCMGVESNGAINLYHTCKSAGLGNQPYRDGTFDYYVSEPQRNNDFKGIGAFILAANEIERTGQDSVKSPQKVVLLDYFYNCEWKHIAGKKTQFHYIWEDTANSGFSQLASTIEVLGARVDALHSAPTVDRLERCSVYVIVDPDTPAETPQPDYIEPSAADQIEQWVRQGGVLVLMANDSGNCEFSHLNVLAGRFGIKFNEDSYHRVVGNNFEMGRFASLPQHPVFAGVKQIYLKEICSLTINDPATEVLSEKGHVFMATARVGKGMVFAVGDPWLYNEYIDARKLPGDYQNGEAGKRLFTWLLDQSLAPKLSVQ
jgi:unsaturated rhamnogalacturonyl hydrolase